MKRHIYPKLKSDLTELSVSISLWRRQLSIVLYTSYVVSDINEMSTT